MKYAINYKRSASEELIQLPGNMAHKVNAAINRLAEKPAPKWLHKDERFG
jgi:mRNA-degrading endonuclease RelE of RelBE toxin-antitoxin system